MVKVYTRGGDRGMTSLFGGGRVEKNSARIEAYGQVDELNSMLGVVLTDSLSADIVRKISRVQKELFVLGGDLATPISVKVKVPRISRSHIKRLEREIDRWDATLPKLKNFILPGGIKVGSKLHLARAIARRVERSIVALTDEESINPNILPYINRLSDWFFVAARYANHLSKIPETIWKGRTS